MSDLLDSDLAALKRHLEPGETIRWAGQPDAARAAWGGAAATAFGVPWTAFALFWMFAASGFAFPPRLDGSSLFALFGLPFVLVGLGLLSAPWWAYRKARRTVYAVTDRRAVVGVPERDGFTLTSFGPDRIADLAVSVRPDGYGSVRFSHTPHTENTRARTDGFVGIAETERVARLLREAAAGAAEDPDADALVPDGAVLALPPSPRLHLDASEPGSLEPESPGREPGRRLRA